MKKSYFSFVLGCFLVMVSFKKLYSHSYVQTESHFYADTTLLAVSGGYSKVKWTGYKIGGKHTGHIEVSSGELLFIDDVLAGGNFEIDMATVSNTDIESEEMKNKLEEHLKSPDFFDVKKHPIATFKIDKVVPYGLVDKDKSKYKIVGQLTMKGITKEIKFEADFFEYNTSYSITARLNFDRSDFNIQYGSGTFFADIGDKIIYDGVLLDLSLAALK
ncbi:MAG: YceI family protein [Saprospiraceae bacterium]